MSALDEESGKLFEAYTFKLWLDQITNGSSVNLTSSELEVEKYILSLAKQFNTSGSRYLKNRLLPIMWVQDAIKSEAYSIYLSQRVSKVYQYALSAGDTEVIEKTNQMAQLDRQISALSDEAEGLAKRHGLLRRLLIYRQTLGAWAALSNLNDRAALSDLDGLLICEKTKL